MSFLSNCVVTHLKHCSKISDVESAFARMIKVAAHQDCFLMNQFITACSALGATDQAVLACSQMDNPNVFVFNAMLKGFVGNHRPVEAVECYVQMLRAQLSSTSYTFSSLVKACCLVSDARVGESVHGQILKNGFASSVFACTTLIEFYFGLERIFDSLKVFDEMPERDVFAWTTMVSCLARAGELSYARRLFDRMPERNIATWNTMLDGYARLKDVESAERLFSQMLAKDVISWTTMINCYSQNEKFREAIGVFSEMINNGISPDEVTLASVISACAHLGALELGKEMHLYVMQNGFVVDVYIGSALIDMYAKCGCLERSLLVFYKLRDRNLFCWNAIIDGLAVHGYADEALAMFSRMEREGIKPNGVTFISVLSACAHSGLVEEGRNWFNIMTLKYSCHPQLEHYGCMVDLLSKAGLLEEALSFIRTMNMEPNAVIWGALLGGSKLHRNLDIAQIAVKELMVLEPANSGHYALLVSLHAQVDRWSDAAKVRWNMKDLGVEKCFPGSSCIELEKRIHQFAASDKSHPSSDNILSALSELDGQLKLDANTPPELLSFINL
ncbi:Pentatricopeptide repeat-containing protein At1g06143 [Linum grandiflorum]